MSAVDATFAHILTLALTLAGFACLAVAMPRHQTDLLGRELAPALGRRLRTMGWLLLVCALWPVVDALGWAFGLTVYCGHLSASAALIFISLLVIDRRRRARA